jgi:hypothetical protein
MISKYIEDRKKYFKQYYLNNKEKIKKSSKLFRFNNKDKIKKYKRLYNLNKKEYIKLYRLKNKENIKKVYKLYTLNNKNKIKRYRTKYRLENPHIQNAINAKRKAIKIKATPKFANLNKIRDIYKNCPKGYHVDHIIPLQGKNVCGLHVEWNLQYLTPSANISKSNKLIY